MMLLYHALPRYVGTVRTNQNLFVSAIFLAKLLLVYAEMIAPLVTWITMYVGFICLGRGLGVVVIIALLYHGFITKRM